MIINYKTILENSINGKIIEEKQGASGVIYIVDNGVNTYPRKVAYKSIRVDKLSDTKKKHFLNECDLWFEIPNSYLIRAFYPIIIDDLPFICIPYYELDLKSFMLNRDLSEIEALVISAQLSKALMEMQKAGIKYHQDFNPPNILIDDLSKKFNGYPNYNCLNYSIKIADFGIADLIEKIGPTIGGGGGKFPFKAPEQYDTKKYRDYNPDIFALGVIVYMLFSNLHPNGLEKPKALNKNTSSSKFKKWAFNAKIQLKNKNIERIINKSLGEVPSDRPSAKEFYNVLMSELSKSDKKTHDNLKLRFDYFDNNNQFDPLSKEIDILKKLSNFPHNRNLVYKRVMKIIQDLLYEIHSEQDLIKLSEYYKMLIVLSKVDNPYILIQISKKIIELFSKWHPKIRVYHKYPQQEFKNEIIQKPPDFRDIEVVSNYLDIIYTTLKRHLSIYEIEELFKKYNDDIFYSIFLYSKASLIRNSDIYKAIEFLEKAEEINPKEPLFIYMKYLWITHNSAHNKDKELDEIKNKSYKELKKHHMYWETIKKL